jgi:hypothetical protein
MEAGQPQQLRLSSHGNRLHCHGNATARGSIRKNRGDRWSSTGYLQIQYEVSENTYQRVGFVLMVVQLTSVEDIQAKPMIIRDTPSVK